MRRNMWFRRILRQSNLLKYDNRHAGHIAKPSVAITTIISLIRAYFGATTAKYAPCGSVATTI